MALTSTNYTYQFVAANLPPAASDILEIGCGAGALACLLQADGRPVVAIDSDADAVAEAQAAGVDARLIAWPADVGKTFDAVLFTRSLHHIHPLDRAIAGARAAVRPGGRIIVEDFRAEGGSESSDRWFKATARQLSEGGALRDDSSLEQLLAKVVPDEHDLHSSSAIAEALGTLGPVEAADAAYYFRYFEPHLRDPQMAEQLLETENRLIGAGSIEALGKRFVVHG